MQSVVTVQNNCFLTISDIKVHLKLHYLAAQIIYMYMLYNNPLSSQVFRSTGHKKVYKQKFN